MNRNFLRCLLGMTFLYLCPIVAEIENSVELRSVALFHSSSRFRNIYRKVSGCYEIEASTRWNEWDCFETWANFDWFSKRGHSIGLSDPTKVQIVTFSAGIKFPFQLAEQSIWYLGIGPSIGRIRLKNHGEFCRQKRTEIVYGGVIKTGVNYFFTECLFVDLFADYLYQPNNFETHVDLGGIKVGAGIGVKW